MEEKRIAKCAVMYCAHTIQFEHLTELVKAGWVIVSTGWMAEDTKRVCKDCFEQSGLKWR